MTSTALLGLLTEALLVSLALTLAVRDLTLRFGWLDRPGAHKQHGAPTPTLGGLGVFGGFLFTLSSAGLLTPALQAVLGAGALMVIVGLLDDLRGVDANLKLLALAGACAALMAGGVGLRVLDLPTGPASLLTFLWIGLVSSAFNGVDNADGAASGLAALSSFFAFTLAWATWQTELALVALALGGACLGFLWFNFPRPRATIFLGDSGSFFIGFCLAAMIILGEWSDSGLKAVVIGLTLLAVPLFDFTLILVLRGLHGKYRRLTDPITMCARDHTFHRLVAMGLSGREALLVLYAAAVLTGSCAVAMAAGPQDQALTLFGGLLALALLAAWRLDRAPLPEEPETAPPAGGPER